MGFEAKLLRLTSKAGEQRARSANDDDAQKESRERWRPSSGEEVTPSHQSDQFSPCEAL
jgi:hypothetical protein